jgi:hypothetical protein
MLVFPTHLLGFSGIAADIERRVTSGGISLSGQEDVVASDGGGRFFVEFNEPYLDQREIALAWRAIAAKLGDGPVPIIVPIGDLRHQFNQEIRVPQGLPWWTEAEYVTADTGATASAIAALRDLTLEVAISFLPGPLMAGMWLSIDHPTMRHRAYRIAEVVAQNNASASLVLSHPLREAVSVGTPIEFVDPRCVCHVDGTMLSPTTFGFTEISNALRFVEDFRSSYS